MAEQPIAPSAPADVLAIAAHRDDVEQTCGGTLLRMHSLGVSTAILDLTQGEAGTRGSASERAAEAAEAARILGAGWRGALDIPDGRVENTWENRLKIVEALRRIRPRVVILPYWTARHPDHATASTLGYIDWLIMLVYFAFVLGIGFALKRYMRTSNDFFLAGRSIPAWVCGLAFISANLGAQEVIGMGASGAKYGIVTSHFYWIGAIPAMCFVGIFMMPFYYGSKARSCPSTCACASTRRPARSTPSPSPS
jgi:hypothetical protein